MIYIDMDAEKWAKLNRIELEETPCPWKCGKMTTPKAVQLKESKGIKYECECGAWSYRARPGKNAKFWDSII